MAQLKDSLVAGDLRVTGTIYGNALLGTLNASGTGIGTNGQVLTSTGSGLKWTSLGTLSSKSTIGNHTVTTPTGATSRTADVALNTTTVNSITAVGSLPTLTVTSVTAVTGGTTTDIPNISKKTVVTGGSTTNVPNVTSVGSAPTLSYTARSIPNVTAAGTASYANGVLTITNTTLGTAIAADDITSWSAGSAPTLGTAIKAYTSLTTGDSVGVGTAIKAYTSLSTTDIGSASGWSAGTLPTKGSNTTVATSIKTQPTFSVTTQSTTLTHSIS